MRTIRIATHLAAKPDVVKNHVMTPALLNYVVAGLMKFRPIVPTAFPDRWTPGKYTVLMLAFHAIPVGRQVVGIELPQENDDWLVRDNGSGSIARVWDHLIFVEPDGTGSELGDIIERIEIIES